MLDKDELSRLEKVEAVPAIKKLKHIYWHYNDTGLRGDDIAISAKRLSSEKNGRRCAHR